MSERRGSRALLLDLDGTLADTAPDLTDALERALVANAYPGVDATALRGFISGGGRAMVEFALGPGVPEDERDRVRHQFLDEYLANICVRTRLYPGMPEVLQRVEQAGLPWGIVTNKLGLYTRPLVTALGLDTRAGCVICGDTLSRAKPHPDPLLHAAALLGRMPDECIYVGDHARDIQAGRAAGMRTLAALFGYIEADADTNAWGADATIEDATAILDWLESGVLSGAERGVDADTYLRERFAPPGSTLYYCTMFVPLPQARRSIALEGLRAELDNIIDDCREPAVAGARVGWWHEELLRLGAGDPQHPVTRVLAEVLGERKAAAEQLAAAVVATATASSRQSWSSEAELEHYCLATAGEIAAIDCARSQDTERVRGIGAALCAHEMLANLWRRPRRGCQAFPASLMTAAGVSPADIFALPTPDAVDGLLRSRAAELRARLAQRLGDWRGRTAAERVLAARARIGIATLAAIRRGGAGWLARHTAVSPFRKLWIGWRSSRGGDRTAPDRARNPDHE